MNNISIAFYDTKPYDRCSFDGVNKSFDFRIKYFPSRLNPDTAALSRGYDAVCIFVNDSVTPEVIDILIENGVRILALRCAGFNNVDLRYIHGKIPVVRVPAYSPYAVAEHAVALMMSLNRKIHKAYYRTRDNNFSINGYMGFDMHGKTAGIIGTGKIGRILAGILRGFGMKILAYDLYPDEEYARKEQIRYVPLETIYRESDIISLHAPLTVETKHMINRETLRLMEKGVMLINTSRGQLIETAALIEGLKSQRIGSAGLDVYEEEADYFFEDFSDRPIQDDNLARLLTFNNVLITSHQAFFTSEAMTNIAETTLDNIREFFSRGSLRNQVPCPD